ncbi:hypothetical protein B0H13DRAFT_1898688 [Mycena leptocephala]|nr:hypothetical protein B0H13DRAFT_1898688 [Mycena leptocephala]
MTAKPIRGAARCVRSAPHARQAVRYRFLPATRHRRCRCETVAVPDPAGARGWLPPRNAAASLSYVALCSAVPAGRQPAPGTTVLAHSCGRRRCRVWRSAGRWGCRYTTQCTGNARSGTAVLPDPEAAAQGNGGYRRLPHSVPLVDLCPWTHLRKELQGTDLSGITTLPIVLGLPCVLPAC